MNPITKLIDGLRQVPVDARAYVYRVAVALGALAVALEWADIDTVGPVLNVFAVVLNLGATALATANTPRPARRT